MRFISENDEPVELRQLRYVDAVAEHGSFTRAAAHLHVAQSAVSAQVMALERELGTAVFARTTRRVTLTPAGELVLARARRVLAELDGVAEDLADVTGVVRGRLALGATHVLGPLYLPDVLAGFAAAHPGVELSLRSGLVADLLAALDAREVDLVLGPVHPGVSARYAAVPLVDEGLVLITPVGHPAAAEGSARLADLASEPFVCLAPGSGLRALLDAAAEEQGVTPNVRFETHSPQSIRELVSAGLGVALVATSTARAPGPPIDVVVPVPGLTHPPIGVFHRRDRPPGAAARAFARRVRRQAAAVTAAPGLPGWPA